MFSSLVGQISMQPAAHSYSSNILSVTTGSSVTTNQCSSLATNKQHLEIVKTFSFMEFEVIIIVE